MDNQTVMIKDIRPGMRNLNVTVIFLEVGPPVRVSDRKLRSCKVADKTACVDLTLWGDAGRFIVPGDIVRLSKLHVELHRCRLSLKNAKSCKIDKIGEFCMIFNEDINMSKPALELAAFNHGVPVSGPLQLARQPLPPSRPLPTLTDYGPLIDYGPEIFSDGDQNKPPPLPKDASGGRVPGVPGSEVTEGEDIDGTIE